MSSVLGDITAAIHACFRKSKLEDGDITQLERALAGYLYRLGKPEENNVVSKLQEELRKLYKSIVAKSPEKLGPFMTVLKVLRPRVLHTEDVPFWLDAVVVSFVDRSDQTRKSAQDAQDFVVEALLQETDRASAKDTLKTPSSKELKRIILVAIRRMDIMILGDPVASHVAASQGYHALQAYLMAFGRRQPLHLFQRLDKFIDKSSTRFQALQILCSWLQQPQAHFDLVVKTPLVGHLVQCLLNDRATPVINLALQAVVMLMPYIPSYVITYLPQLFLIYSRCLQWELYDASTKSESLQPLGETISPSDAPDEPAITFTVSSDWQFLETIPLASDVPDPDLLTLFTYLYGLYPVNFMRYIREPRMYLKDMNCPGAEGYYLDMERIRTRSEQFQRVHLLHPALFGLTPDQELVQNKWVTSEPPEVIAECFGLRVKEQPQRVASLLPSPDGKAPDLASLSLAGDMPQLTPIESGSATLAVPYAKTAATPSTNSPLSVARGDAPPLHTEDMPPLSQIATNMSVSQDQLTNATSTTDDRSAGQHEAIELQQELQIMRSAYQFERYLKQLHVVTIGQLKRDRIRQVIQEAESDRLHATTRTLKKQLEAAIKFNETLQKEAQTRRTHVSKSEEQLTAKIRTLRQSLKDYRELKTKYDQQTQDIGKLRDLVVESEAREARLKSELLLAQQQHQRDPAPAEPTSPPRSALVSGTMPDASGVSLPGIDGTNPLVISEDERDRIRREYEIKILNLEESLALAVKTQNEHAQGAAVLQRKLLESHEKRLALEQALGETTKQLQSVQTRYGLALSPDVTAHEDSLDDRLWQGPPVGDDFSLAGSMTDSQIKAASITTNGNHHSFPTNQPIRLAAKAELADVTVPLSRSEGMSPTSKTGLLPVLGQPHKG